MRPSYVLVSLILLVIAIVVVTAMLTGVIPGYNEFVDGLIESWQGFWEG